MEKVLEVNHLSKSYEYGNNKVQVLSNLSFSIDKGEFIGIMGPSGVGKSMLLNTISLPTIGTVHVDGQDILKRND